MRAQSARPSDSDCGKHPALPRCWSLLSALRSPDRVGSRVCRPLRRNGGDATLAYVRPGFSFRGAIVLVVIFEAIWPSLSVASNELVGSLASFGEGPAMGLFNAAGAIASAFGALAGGAIADHFGYSAVPLFAALAIMAALSTVRLHIRLRGELRLESSWNPVA